MHTNFLIKFDLNTANDGASAKASPFHALIVLGGKRLSILASCMANLSKFHVVFPSSTLIRLDKGHKQKRKPSYENREDYKKALNIFTREARRSK